MKLLVNRTKTFQVSLKHSETSATLATMYIKFKPWRLVYPPCDGF